MAIRSTLLLGFLALTCATCAGQAPRAAVGPAVSPTVTGPYSDCGAKRLKMLGDSQVVVYPPMPTDIIMPPPDIPDDVKGQTYSVLFLINERGQVVADSAPGLTTADTRWLNRFLDRLRRYHFRPARMNGCAVPARFSLSLTF
jgi:hypothetical protein